MRLLISGGGTKWVQPLCIGSPRENGQEHIDGGLDTINIMSPGFCKDWSGLFFLFPSVLLGLASNVPFPRLLVLKWILKTNKQKNLGTAKLKSHWHICRTSCCAVLIWIWIMSNLITFSNDPEFCVLDTIRDHLLCPDWLQIILPSLPTLWGWRGC